jgi:NADH dehydrogenase FAD-containing subunit
MNGVRIYCKKTVKEITDKSVLLEDLKTRELISLKADLVVLTSGVQSNQLVNKLPLEKDRFGRILTTSTLQSKDRPNVFVLGDCSFADTKENQAPATAQVAMQQAGIVAQNVYRRAQLYSSKITPADGSAIVAEIHTKVSSNGELKKFKYLSLGEMLSLGITDASITSVGGLLTLSGPLASAMRRLVYAVRMPTPSQAIKAAFSATLTTTGKVVSNLAKMKTAD